MSAPQVGARIKALREKLGFSQQSVSDHVGFKDRQTLSAIETGERRVTAEELVQFAEVLAAPLDYFTDPFVLAGEARFSWRQSGVAPHKLETYELDTGRLIALHRALGDAPSVTRPGLRLNKSSSYEDAQAAGERFAEQFELGDVPAARLAETMENRFQILVLMVDAIKGVSGAACHLPELDAVIINRCEAPGRRHYDLAHELFHLLTWETMPPEHVEETDVFAKSRVEQLADNFAAALLMPSSALQRFGDWRGLEANALPDRLNAVADQFAVTSQALMWRLVSVGAISKTTARGVDSSRLRNNGRERSGDDLPPLFSRLFVERVAHAIDNGKLSARRASGILGLAVDDLTVVFAAHGIDFDPGL